MDNIKSGVSHKKFMQCHFTDKFTFCPFHGIINIYGNSHKYKKERFDLFMQHSIVLSLSIDERSITKSFDSVSQVLPANTVGSYLSRNRSNMKKITLHIPSMKYSTTFNVVKDSEEVSSIISFYNFVASLEKCGINHIYANGTLIIEIVAQDLATAQFIRSYKEKLDKLI